MFKKTMKKTKRNTTPVLTVKTLAFTRYIRGNECHRRNHSQGKGRRWKATGKRNVGEQPEEEEWGCQAE